MCRAGPRLRMYRTWVLHDGCTGTYARVARARSVIATSSSACNISLFPSHFGPPATSVFFPVVSDRLQHHRAQLNLPFSISNIFIFLPALVWPGYRM